MKKITILLFAICAISFSTKAQGLFQYLMYLMHCSLKDPIKMRGYTVMSSSIFWIRRENNLIRIW